MLNFRPLCHWMCALALGGSFVCVAQTQVQTQPQTPPQIESGRESEHAPLHYSLYRTWALAPPEAEDPFKIVAFLPESYLFRVLERDAEVVSDNTYSRVLTQDGVEVLLYSGAISDWSFRDAIGRHEIIFNRPYRLCKTPGCDRSETVATWPVARGEAFEIAGGAAGYSNTVEVRATRGAQVLSGYLGGHELDRLEQMGALTRTDRELPRYSIERVKSRLLGTSCGDSRSVGDLLTPLEQDDHSGKLAELLGLGRLTEEGIDVGKDYGGEGYSYSFYLYRVTDRAWEANSPERQFLLAAGFKNRCARLGDSEQFVDTFIEHLLFVNSRNQFNGAPMLVDIPARLFNTPEDLRQYTGDAYMISINKPEHFERALAILSQKIGDRALAGYMLTELNRSCRSELRVQYSGSVCRVYDY